MARIKYETTQGLNGSMCKYINLFRFFVYLRAYTAAQKPIIK
jgi:hypothetical protein